MTFKNSGYVSNDKFFRKIFKFIIFAKFYVLNDGHLVPIKLREERKVNVDRSKNSIFCFAFVKLKTEISGEK